MVLRISGRGQVPGGSAPGSRGGSVFVGSVRVWAGRVCVPGPSQPRVLTHVVRVNKGFHVGDARVKKLTPASKRSIGRHVEF